MDTLHNSEKLPVDMKNQLSPLYSSISRFIFLSETVGRCYATIDFLGVVHFGGVQDLQR
jgi:hypothetical protein